MRYILCLIICLASKTALSENAPLSIEEVLSMDGAEYDYEGVEEQRLQIARDMLIASEGIRFSAQHAFVEKLDKLVEQVEKNSREMDVIFDFSAIQILATEQLRNYEEMATLQILFQPPVLAHYHRVRNVNNEQTLYRNATDEYVIKEPARLSEQALDWRFFLTAKPSPVLPNIQIGALPTSEHERGVWQKAVVEGWRLGQEQAISIMQDRVSRLMLVHRGMLSYVMLVDQNIVKAPQISLSMNASEINDSKTHLAVNVLRYRILQKAMLNGNTTQWETKLFSGELQIRTRRPL